MSMRSIFSIVLFLISFICLFGQIPNTLSPSEKVYGLSKFWQEANYNFIFLDKIDREMWDNKYKELIPIVQNTKNDYEYYRELQKFCALLKDGHTNVYFPKEVQDKVMNTMFGEYRLFIKNIEGKAIIDRVNLSKSKEIPIGSEIIEVNGKQTQQYIKEHVMPYISSSTQYILEDWSIRLLLEGLEGDTFIVKIKKPDNKVITLSLTHKITEEKEVYPKSEYSGNILDFKWLDVKNKIAYLGLNTFEDEKIINLFIEKLPELYKAKALVLDLRYNGGGASSIAKSIFEYLTEDDLIYEAKSISRLYIPTYSAWGSSLIAKDTINGKPEWDLTKEEATKSYLMANHKYYYHFEYKPSVTKVKVKKVVIPTTLLIGHQTASAAEDFLIYADKQKHMMKIGENTFGSTGQPLMFTLPGEGTARVCTKKDIYPDGREFVGYGIKPDVEVKMTLKDLLNKKDLVLDKAVEIVKQKIKNNEPN